MTELAATAGVIKRSRRAYAKAVHDNGSACGATGLVLAFGAPASDEPAITAAGAATAMPARPMADEDFGGVDAARGVAVRAAVRGTRE